MIKRFISAMAIGCAFIACESGTDAPPEYKGGNNNNNSSAITVVPVDYTAGRIMNATLGRGINLGNSWDSDGPDDGGWSNPIRDTDFAVIKAAGFNSVRIPVRWQKFSDYNTHTVDPERLKGVKEDIRLAIANGLAVVVNFHHYVELNCAGGGGTKADGTKCKYDAVEYEKEKAHFLALWNQVATEMGEFPDNMVVLEILNEPSIPQEDIVDKLMTDAYTVIRTAAPGKTIMFESYHLAKFYELPSLHLPPDGNIIFSGHYYEPYQYSHQGLGYDCKGDLVKTNTAAKDMKEYASLAFRYYPDVDNVNHVPLNMGEFGVSGGDSSPCQWQKGEAPSETGKAEWAKKTVQAAWENGISFHYWAFGATSGFEAYDGNNWYPGFPGALIF